MSRVFKVISLKEMQSFFERAMTAVGTSHKHAKSMANNLVMSDYRGHFSHGLNRFDFYINDVLSKSCNTEGDPKILHETPSTGHIDGNKLLGPVVGTFCMNLAIEKAKKCGISIVVAKGSNHFGIAEYYSMMALKEGFIGFSFTNSSPVMAMTRGKEFFFGCNVISMAAPGKNGDDFVLDMSTLVASYGKIEIAKRKGEKRIPEGWAIDKDGESTTDIDKIHTLLPLGGLESTGGYKGAGLAMAVEILCGVLSGSACSPDIRKYWNETCDWATPANCGHCFIAINPNFFGLGFTDRMAKLIDQCRNQEPAKGQTEILIAGDIEKRYAKKCDSDGGISYHIKQIEHAYEIASRLKIEPPKALGDTNLDDNHYDMFPIDYGSMT